MPSNHNQPFCNTAAAVIKKWPRPLQFATDSDCRYQLLKPRELHVDKSSCAGASSFTAICRQRWKCCMAAGPRAPAAMLHYKGQEDMGGNIAIPCMLSTLSTMSSYKCPPATTRHALLRYD